MSIMTAKYVSTIFDTPAIHVIRLGYITRIDSGVFVQTVGDWLGGHKRSLSLTSDQHDLLMSLDPTTGDRGFTPGQREFLLWMANEGYLALVGESPTITDLTIVPVPRREIEVIESKDDGYILRVEGGEPFALSELGARFLPQIDGFLPLSEIASVVKTGILSEPGGPGNVEKNENSQGRGFDSFLKEDAFNLIRVMTSSRAMTFESMA